LVISENVAETLATVPDFEKTVPSLKTMSCGVQLIKVVAVIVI
jgi:hypothetical protein